MIHDMRVGKLSGWMGQADEYNHGRVIGSDMTTVTVIIYSHQLP